MKKLYKISRKAWVRDFEKRRGMTMETIAKLNLLLATNQPKVERCPFCHKLDPQKKCPCRLLMFGGGAGSPKQPKVEKCEPWYTKFYRDEQTIKILNHPQLKECSCPFPKGEPKILDTNCPFHGCNCVLNGFAQTSNYCRVHNKQKLDPQLKVIEPMKKEWIKSEDVLRLQDLFVVRALEKHFDKINELTERVNLIINLLNKQ